LINTPTVSVVIPTRNEAAWLDTNLRILTEIPIVSEIIVADASSTDQTPDIALRRGCIVTDGGRPGAGRNAGRKAATSEFILFLDVKFRTSCGLLCGLRERVEQWVDDFLREPFAG